MLDDNTQGLTHRLILALVPERRKNRLASRGSNAGRPDSRRRSSCLRLQMFSVETFSFLPECQRDGRDLACERETCHIGLHSLGQQSFVKVLQWSGATTGAHGRTLEDLLHLVVVILVQAPDQLRLFGTLQLTRRYCMNPDRSCLTRLCTDMGRQVWATAFEKWFSPGTPRAYPNES